MRRHLSVIAIGLAAFTLAHAAPPNDDCAGAIVIPSEPFTTEPVDITDATPQDVNEGLHFCAADGADRTIWYSFTPTESAPYLITTCPADGATGGTVYDPVISVFESVGGTCSQQALLACADGSPFCATSIPGAPYVDEAAIITELSAGTTYFIVAGHWTDDFGGVSPGFENLVVHVEKRSSEPNDKCDNPTPLALNRVTQGSTLDAVDDYRSPANAACFSGIGQIPSSAPGRDVVFSFEAPVVGPAGKYSFRYVQDDAGAALRSQNPVLYLSYRCPLDEIYDFACIQGANRLAVNGAANGNRSEEISCVPLCVGCVTYLAFDDDSPGNLGGPFAIDVSRCVEEVEPNGTPATATPYAACGMTGTAGSASDADFFSLGAPPAGSKVFLGIDAAAANDGDFEMRLTNATATLGYDDNDGTSWISANAPIVAGPFADGSELYARVNKGSIAAQLTASEPYRLYARIETGLAQQEVDDPDNASYYFGNHVTGGGFVAGVMATINDEDCFRFVANEGDNIALFSDNNPTRAGGTITNVWPILRDVVGAPPTRTRFTGQVVRNNVAPSPGTLTGTSPSVTSEFSIYRARYTGTYMACFMPTTDINNVNNPPAGAYPLPYQGSISLNCGPVPAPASRVTDVGVTKRGPAGPVNTGEIIEYTITLTNHGTDVAEDVRLTDALPPELVFVGFNVNDGFSGDNVGCIALPSLGSNGDIVDCTNFSIAPGASTTFTLQLQVANCIGAGITVVNTASISTLSTDPNPANDASTWTFTTSDSGTCSDLLCDTQGCIVDHCTSDGHCEAGACITTPINCDDNNLCTDDVCDPTDADGQPCQHPDAQLYCFDGNPCTHEICDPILACIYPPEPPGFPCGDFSGCTPSGVCDGRGTCIDPTCDDGLPCTDDYADPSNNCACSNPLTFPGTLCDDGNSCTQNTTCDGFGGSVDHCNGGILADCNDGNPCTDDSCDSATGCVHTNNTAPCSDGNACTIGETCGGGACGGGVPISCAASDQCHFAGTCDPASGACSNPALPNGTTCDDGNAGTSGDSCQNGVCVGGATCTPSNDPKTWGWWRSQCTSGGHSGDSIDNADAACVAATVPAFSDITTADQVCDVLNPSHGNGAQSKAERQLMALALNICSRRICPSQGLDAICSSAATVGQALSNGSVVLANPSRTAKQLAVVECQATEINNGRALELDSLTLSRESGAVRLSWLAPILDDGSGAPAGYKVWRRPLGSLVAFTQIGTTAGTTLVDTSAGSGAWEYNLTPITP